jgi:hypothetical protein
MAESFKGARLAPFVKAGQFDALMLFKDAGLVAASAAATVAAAAKVVDVGTGLFKACMILDVSELEIASDNEIFDIVIQGSPDAAFTDTGVVELAQLSLSAAEVKRTDCNRDDAEGRYKLYFDNEFNGSLYRYIRVYTVVDGTIATGINYSAYAVPME